MSDNSLGVSVEGNKVLASVVERVDGDSSRYEETLGEGDRVPRDELGTDNSSPRPFLPGVNVAG